MQLLYIPVVLAIEHENGTDPPDIERALQAVDVLVPEEGITFSQEATIPHAGGEEYQTVDVYYRLVGFQENVSLESNEV